MKTVRLDLTLPVDDDTLLDTDKLKNVVGDKIDWIMEQADFVKESGVYSSKCTLVDKDNGVRASVDIRNKKDKRKKDEE